MLDIVNVHYQNAMMRTLFSKDHFWQSKQYCYIE